ncbi:MAG TPA: exonuclease domain-containing protein [Clostridia bacterium]|nr:exonuclease domain-containing protein [Clostridia bacterium]
MSSYDPFGASPSPLPRERTGRSRLLLAPDYTALDVETTGLDAKWNAIIEFGAIRVRGGCIDERFSALVNPGYLLDPFITELTGITDDMLAFAPGIGEVLPGFLDFVGDDLVVGHNVMFDIGFISSACLAVLSKPFCNDFTDTMRLSRRLFPQHAHHRLTDLVERFGVGDAVEHRALADAAQTVDCYEYMKAYARRRGMGEAQLAPAGARCSAKDIRAARDNFNVNCACYGKTFVFTGELEDMTRQEAMQAVADRGGLLGDSVTRRTNYLVLGQHGYATTIRGGESAKQKKAEQMKLGGFDIGILTESEFYNLLGDE